MAATNPVTIGRPIAAAVAHAITTLAVRLH
jgi:hypothetical protein